MVVTPTKWLRLSATSHFLEPVSAALILWDYLLPMNCRIAQSTRCPSMSKSAWHLEFPLNTSTPSRISLLAAMNCGPPRLFQWVFKLPLINYKCGCGKVYKKYFKIAKESLSSVKCECGLEAVKSFGTTSSSHLITIDN